MFNLATPSLSVVLSYIIPLILNVTVSFANSLPCPSTNVAPNAFASLTDFVKSVAAKTDLTSILLETAQSLYSAVIM